MSAGFIKREMHQRLLARVLKHRTCPPKFVSKAFFYIRWCRLAYIERALTPKRSNEFARTLTEVSEGLELLQEEVITAGFDPDDHSSVQAAIEHAEATINAKVARFQGDALAREGADQIKAECRANILPQVEAHRRANEDTAPAARHRWARDH